MEPAADIRVRERVARAYPAFADRAEAGLALARFAVAEPDPDALVLALPRGGVPVGVPLTEALGCELRPVLVRKLPVPSSPEMGFGAVALDGTRVLNRRLVALEGLLPETIERVTAEVVAELERRARAYPGGTPLPPMAGRRVWLADDGLATGYSVLAAARMARSHGAAWLGVAVPVATSDALSLLSAEVDAVFCLIAQERGPFGVASFYREWRDLTDDEVRRLLTEARER